MKLYLLKARPLPPILTWHVLRTCVRRVTLPLELALIRRGIAATEKQFNRAARGRYLAERDGNVELADDFDREASRLWTQWGMLIGRRQELEQEAGIR